MDFVCVLYVVYLYGIDIWYIDMLIYVIGIVDITDIYYLFINRFLCIKNIGVFFVVLE
ncbi:hypothetical protein BZA77DRAFT_320812 [Pyronema omphalodes]|nr:hypothetical protein BZA77DRAFT_320812 [Pyronema omphalodes]